jgi:drug/metabolite transporter (DMT)-like permease
VFAAFSALYLGEAVTPRQWAGFVLIAVAAVLIVGD